MVKNYLLGLFLLAATAVGAQTTLSKTININGTNRTYRIYIPALYNSAVPVPLVFNFHGLGSTSQEQEIYGDFRPIADTANFIIVHPQGLDLGGAAGWNNFGTISSSNYDYVFVNELLDTLIANYSIDDKRVYSTGMSNGGFMSYDLACFMSTRLAAIASVTGSMIFSHLNACQPDRVMPVMQIHGTSDGTVSYNGSGGVVSSVHIDSLVKFWAKLNGCNLTPTITNVPNSSTTDLCTAEHYVFDGGLNGNTVEFYKIIGGGHTWPGSNYPIPGLNTNQDFDASAEIWRFFSKYSIENQQGGLEELKQAMMLKPNPFTNRLEIDLKQNSGARLFLYDISGKMVFTSGLHEGLNVLENFTLQKGFYLYSILEVNESNVLYSGKLYCE